MGKDSGSVKYDNKMIRLKWVEIALLVISAGIIFWQVHQLKRQVDILNRQVTIIESDSQLNRPFLADKKPGTTVKAEGEIDVFFWVTNYGQIPAVEVDLDYEVLLGGMLHKPVAEEEPKRRCVMPGEESLVEHYNFKGDDFHAVWSGKKKLHANIKLKYKGLKSNDEMYEYRSTWKFLSTGPKTFDWILVESDTE